MLQDTRHSRADILSLKYSDSQENLERCHGMVGEQTERQPGDVPVPPGRGRHAKLGPLKASPAAAATRALGLPPSSPLPTGAMGPLTGYFC